MRDKFIRPSSLGAVALCEARPTMESHVVSVDGEQKPAAVADLGHDLHSRFEHAVIAWKKSAAWDDAIADALAKATAEGVDSWSVYCLRFTLETLRDLIDKHSVQRDNVLTEHSLAMDAMGFSQNGTADVVLVIPNVLVIVIDNKFGYVDQGDAEDHDQLSIYAAAAADQFTAPDVIVALVQPRAEKANRITQAKFDADSLRANRAWTRSVINLARRPNPPLTAGYEQCKFCRALPRCPEARKYIMDAKEALETIGAPLDADGFGQLADAAKLADKFAETGKDMAKDRLQEGLPVTGWRLGTPRAIRSVSNVPSAIQRLEAAGYGQEAAEAISLSPSKLTPAAVAVIEDQITEKLSSPPLTQAKGSRS